MGNLLDLSIVRIHHSNGGVAGVGFLIHHNFVLSCSHTINSALGLPGDANDKPQGLIKLDFPFIQKQRLFSAQIVEWHPKNMDNGDIAVLELTEAQPVQAKSARMVQANKYQGHTFSVYGCPQDFQKDGRWVEGKLQHFLPNGRLQAIGTSDIGYFIEPGFSGSPVWDDVLKAVIGMVVSVDRIDDKLQASIIPTNTLINVYPNLPLIGPVFISYSRKDGEDFARRLKTQLQKNQFDVWIDVSDIPAAARWNKQIDKAVESASVLIVVMTPNAVESIQVESEWNYALSLKKPIVPLLVQDCDVPRVLAMLNYIDFRNPQEFDKQMTLLVNRLRDIDEEDAASYERLTGIRLDRTKQYPIVIGQRLSTTMEYFQNRYDQLANIGRLLISPDTRIVSIIGPGGIGKTALVSKFLFDLENNLWPHTSQGKKVDGIVYLSHRTVGISLERLFLDCAEMLGGNKKKDLNSIWISTQMDTTEKIMRLLEMINEGLYIVLLDNIEDLLDERGNLMDPDLSTFIQMSLATPGNARLLVTSREPIRFSPKNAPLDKQVLLDEGLDVDYGIEMLRQADPSGLYGLKDAEKEKLAKIVEMVHGVPRALEVFAGIVKDEESGLMTLDEIMEQFFKHPMTERELIIEGYRRLDPNARRILEGLAVFGRPVPIGAVRFLLEPFMPDIDIMNIVLRLVRIHMISVVDKQKKLVALHPFDRDFAYRQIPSL